MMILTTHNERILDALGDLLDSRQCACKFQRHIGERVDKWNTWNWRQFEVKQRRKLKF